MKKSISLLLAGLLAGTVCADTNWKAWVRPAGTVTEGENASFTAEAKEKTGFSTRIKLENGNFYKVSFRLAFPGDAPASFKYGFYSPDLHHYDFLLADVSNHTPAFFVFLVR